MVIQGNQQPKNVKRLLTIAEFYSTKRKKDNKCQNARIRDEVSMHTSIPNAKLRQNPGNQNTRYQIFYKKCKLFNSYSVSFIYNSLYSWIIALIYFMFLQEHSYHWKTVISLFIIYRSHHNKPCTKKDNARF